MAADALVWVLVAAVAGLALSVAIERLMVPRPPLVRPWPAWALHAGLWLFPYGVLVLALGRSGFAAAAVSAFLLMLVLVNNAKFKALREPFVFQDYEYFVDAIRHPRLYIPFLGWGKFILATLGFASAIAVGLWVELAPTQRFSLNGQLGGVVALAIIGGGLLFAGSRAALPVSFLPERDLATHGLLACLWRYAEEARDPPQAASPFDYLPARMDAAELPHLVAVQSESFFDPRPLFAGIREDVLAGFDRVQRDAFASGKLKVPAWGANTVRSEFAFLSGVTEKQLGAHRFNPYRAIAAGCDVSSIAHFLKHLGYRTVCIHPYPASFYQRDRVFPRLGFDEFIDIREFAEADRFGPYVGDAAVAAKIGEVLQKAAGPLFVFAITMENHGPLHLENVAPSDIDSLYHTPPPVGFDDLTIYLRHLRNADRMIATLRAKLEGLGRRAGLCWFGDHVPIMPAVYQAADSPSGEVDYLLWTGDTGVRRETDQLAVHDLAVAWLRAMGLLAIELS